MIRLFNEKMQIAEYVYPFADKVNPPLRTQILALNDPNSKPTNINAQFTGWHLKGKEVSTLTQWVDNLITNDFNKLRYTLKCTEVWGVLYKKGDYITEHQHSPSIYSFVYYVNAPKGSSPLKFSTSGHKVKPEAGKLVIFESRLVHEVPPNKGEDRCIVSGNFIWDKDSGTVGVLEWD